MAKKKSRQELAAEITAAVEAILDDGSRRVGGESVSRYHCNRAKVGVLSISRCSPVVDTDGHIHRSAVISIWAPNNGKVTKVLSADVSPFYLMGFHKGAWIKEILPHALAAD